MTLVRRARDEPELFTVLFRRHVRDVHAFVWRRTRNDALTDDITAVTFEKCWAALPGFRPRHPTIRPWLLRIAAHELAGHFRSERRRDAREVRTARREARHVDSMPAMDDVGLLDALADLPERDQVVLSLRFLADLSTEETAAAMGVGRRHCAVIQHRALAALRRRLEGGEP